MTQTAATARNLVASLIALALVSACRSETAPDAYGNFEATEVVVSAQTSGQIETFMPVDGMRIASGVDVALIDTTQLAIQREQVAAERSAAQARTTQSTRQLAILTVQRDIAQRAYERTRRLYSEQAATAQQLDQAQRDYEVLLRQIDAARAEITGVAMQEKATGATVASVSDRIAKSRVRNPVAGTVLTTYARAGEVVQPGTPLYRIANLDTLVLRAYVSEPQLRSFRVGQAVRVNVDRKNGAVATLRGIVSWVSSTSEFTPTPVQTRDERADLVYAVKILVPNGDGTLKIGMPADVTLSPAAHGS